MDSSFGTPVRPSSRVNITVWFTDGRVSSHLSAAAAANAELTPGTGQPPLGAETFANVAREFLLAEAVIMDAEP